MVYPMRILIVDDEDTIREALSAWLTKEGYHVLTAGAGKQALDLLEEQLFDLYLVDIKMPGMDGLELLARIKELHTDAIVIMITAHASIQSAVEAMKLGGADYLCKPFDPEELSLLLERVTANKALREENIVLREQLREQRGAVFNGFVAQSASMRHVLAMVADVAQTSSSVLITGETGVGKDLVARALHAQSAQSSGPFVAINCGAQSETLLESELFGHERGAFTGAVRTRRGRLEMADNGTLFLDEVGEISMRMQVGLLRVLEEKRLLRVGGSRPVRSDFRLICATHRDLPNLIRQERFREDFYYRINVFTIDIPPLRERMEDISVLADYFLERYVEEIGKPIEGFTRKAIDILEAYAWPGNVRELRNVIERAVVIARGRMIGVEELRFLRAGAQVCDAGAMTLRDAEIRHLICVLTSCGWNVTRSAKILDIDRVTLTRKMKRYALARP